MAPHAVACDVTGVPPSSPPSEPLVARRLVRVLTSGSTAPALVETEDGGLFVLKLRASAVGSRSLAAEWIAAGVAQALGLRTPEPRSVVLPPEVAAQERHAELAEVLQQSAGLNLGLVYVEDARDVPRFATPIVPSDLAAKIVWLDVFLKNPDRTVRNPNLMEREGEWWVIDHGACRVFEDDRAEFPPIGEHMFLHRAGDLAKADALARSRLSGDDLARICETVPADWWGGEAPTGALRRRYSSGDAWLAEAEALRSAPPIAVGPRPDRRPAWARRPSV